MSPKCKICENDILYAIFEGEEGLCRECYIKKLKSIIRLCYKCKNERVDIGKVICEKCKRKMKNKM